MKALGQLTTSIVALICLLPYVVLGQDLAPETNFTIVQNTPIDSKGTITSNKGVLERLS